MEGPGQLTLRRGGAGEPRGAGDQAERRCRNEVAPRHAGPHDVELRLAALLGRAHDASFLMVICGIALRLL